MSKKKYTYGKEVGCNTVRGYLVSAEEMAAIRHYLFLAGLKFLLEAKKDLKNGMPKHITMHEWRKYKKVTSLCDNLANRMPHAYVMA